MLRLGEGGHPRAQLLGGQLPGKDLPDVRDDLLQRARPLRKVVAGFDDAEKVARGLGLEVVAQVDRHIQHHRALLFAQRDFLGKGNEHHRGQQHRQGGVVAFGEPQYLLHRHDALDDFEPPLRHPGSFELAGTLVFGAAGLLVGVVVF